MSSIDFNGIAGTAAACAIAIATVSTSVISIRTQRAANRLAHQQAKTAEAASLAAEQVKTTLATNTEITNTKLDTIHTLVNSNMTAAMQAELDATKRELVWMQGVHQPDADALNAIAVTESRIEELQGTLSDRTAAAAAAAAAAAKDQ